MDFQIDAASDTLDSAHAPMGHAPLGRLTPARQTVIRILKATDRAMTHHEIEQQARADGIQFDRVTLYRALEWLVTKELAHKVAAEDRIWRFSAARGSNRDQAYFHCSHCGAVYCLDLAPSYAPVAVPEGFKAKQIEIMVRGECGKPECKR